MIHNVDDISVINDAYANGYADCERDLRDDWERTAWYKGFGAGCSIGIVVTTFVISMILLIFGG